MFNYLHSTGDCFLGFLPSSLRWLVPKTGKTLSAGTTPSTTACITRHKSNNHTARSTVELVEILTQHTKNFIAIVYCQRFGTPSIYEYLRQLDISFNNAKTKLLSKRKKRGPEFALEIKNSTPGLYWSAILSQRSYEINQQSIASS